METMTTHMDQYHAELAACKTIPAVERWEDETWATIPIADGPTNTLVLRLTHERKIEIRRRDGNSI